MKTSIALIRQRYAADGGAERFVSRLAAALASDELDVALVTRGWEPSAGVRVVTCNPFYLGRVWRDWSFARCACHTLAGARFDLVQSHERIPCCDVYRAGDGVHREWLRQRLRSLPRARQATVAFNPYHYYVKKMERAVFESTRLRAVICNSEMVRQEALTYFKVAPAKLHVIYSGVDAGAFHPDLTRHRQEIRARFGIAADATLFLFVGSGFERKGLRSLLTALAQLPADACLLVVGDDKHLDRYRRHADRLGLARRVVFAGAQADVKPFYGAADVFVLPTLYDPFPNAVLEAMAVGLPIVTSTKCGAAELLGNDDFGFAHDALDVAAIAQSMKRLQAPAYRAPRGAAARRVAERFSPAKMRTEIARLYQRLLVGSGA